MPNPIPKNTPQLYPRLAYRDVAKATEWLIAAFGLSERSGARTADENGNTLFTEMELGDGLIMISREGSHDLQSPQTLGGRSQMVIAYVYDVDAHFASAKAAGAKIAMELADQPWGDRRYEAFDHEGHRWYFASHFGKATG